MKMAHARKKEQRKAAVAADAGQGRQRRRGAPLAYVAPMKPVLVNVLPVDTAHWLYEVKFDGFRVIALKTGESVELWSSTQKRLDFPGVAAALASVPCKDAIFDGEIVAVDAAGRSSFQRLQNSREADANARICVYLFDLLWLDGKDLRGLDTVGRKTRLATLLDRSPADERRKFSANLEGDPGAILEAVKRAGLEGVVAKTRTAAYEAGAKSPLWQKVKIVAEQDFVIGGYTPPEGTRRYFGSLLVGCYRQGKLQFVARVGTGFSNASLENFFRLFQPMKRTGCPFVNLPATQAGRWGQGITAAKMKLCTWIEPTLVCRVRFAEWTDDGALRHPVFLGLRKDKVARRVGRETEPG